MNRRDAVVTLVAIPSLVFAQGKAAAPKVPTAPAAPAAPPFAAAIDAAEHCIGTGRACLELAIATLKKGDASMAECADTTRLMITLCETFATFATNGSAHTKALAAICAKACRDCEKACRKHELHHAACRACGESCAKCALECEKIAA